MNREDTENCILAKIGLVRANLNEAGMMIVVMQRAELYGDRTAPREEGSIKTNIEAAAVLLKSILSLFPLPEVTDERVVQEAPSPKT